MVFELDTRLEEGWTVIAVNGELDVATAPRLRQEAIKALGASPSHLALDLSECSFIDSTGLGVIVGILKRIRGSEGDLVIVGAPPQVTKVFDITRVSSIVTLAESLDQAVQAKRLRTPAAEGGD